MDKPLDLKYFRKKNRKHDRAKTTPTPYFFTRHYNRL